MKLKALLLCTILIGLVAFSGAVQGVGPVELGGHVQDSEGTALVGATIFVHDLTNNVTFDPVLTDSKGDFLFSAPSGKYSVSAEMATYRANGSYSNVTTSNDHLNFTMLGLGTVTGYITDDNGTLHDVKVTLKNSVEEFTAYTTKPWGQFTIENVTEGQYIATAELLGYAKSTNLDPVKVARAQTYYLNFTMTEVADKSAQLNGQVTYDGKPVQGVKVTVVPLEGAELVTFTDAQGNYLIKGVTPGQYQLMLSKSGYIGTSQKITLLPLDQKAVDVVLKKDSLPGNSGFILDYDLAHSMMVVGLGLALFTTIVAIILRYRARKKPEILENDEGSVQ